MAGKNNNNNEGMPLPPEGFGAYKMQPDRQEREGWKFPLSLRRFKKNVSRALLGGESGGFTPIEYGEAMSYLMAKGDQQLNQRFGYFRLPPGYSENAVDKLLTPGAQYVSSLTTLGSNVNAYYGPEMQLKNNPEVAQASQIHNNQSAVYRVIGKIRNEFISSVPGFSRLPLEQQNATVVDHIRRNPQVAQYYNRLMTGYAQEHMGIEILGKNERNNEGNIAARRLFHVGNILRFMYFYLNVTGPEAKKYLKQIVYRTLDGESPSFDESDKDMAGFFNSAGRYLNSKQREQLLQFQKYLGDYGHVFVPGGDPVARETLAGVFKFVTMEDAAIKDGILATNETASTIINMMDIAGNKGADALDRAEGISQRAADAKRFLEEMQQKNPQFMQVIGDAQRLLSDGNGQLPAKLANTLATELKAIGIVFDTMNEALDFVREVGTAKNMVNMIGSLAGESNRISAEGNAVILGLQRQGLFYVDTLLRALRGHREDLLFPMLERLREHLPVDQPIDNYGGLLPVIPKASMLMLNGAMEEAINNPEKAYNDSQAEEPTPPFTNQNAQPNPMMYGGGNPVVGDDRRYMINGQGYPVQNPYGVGVPPQYNGYPYNPQQTQPQVYIIQPGSQPVPPQGYYPQYPGQFPQPTPEQNFGNPPTQSGFRPNSIIDPEDRTNRM